MADNSGIIKVALFGGVVYLAYTQGWLSFLGLTPSMAVATPTTTPIMPVTPAPNPNAITGANSLDAIFQRVVTAANAPTAGLNVDSWGYYLNAELGKIGKSAPDPMPIFTSAVANFDRSQLLNAAQYWAVMAPALKTQLGLSGLGIYGGMAGYMMRRYA